MSCYLSSGCFQSDDPVQVLSQALKHGLDLELSSGLAAVEMESLEQARGRINFLVHNYFPSPTAPFVLNLASTNHDIHRRSVDLCRHAIDLSVRLGAPFYSVHAGFALNLHPADLGDPVTQGRLAAGQSIPRDIAYEIFVTTIKNLASYATARNVRLLVENNVVAQENLAPDGSYPLLLADVTELHRFCADIGDSMVGLLLDTGHAKVSAATLGVCPEAYLEELAPFIGCLHLSDNDGRRDSNLHITDTAWFAQFLPRFATLPMVVEVYRLPLEQMLAQRQIVTQLAAKHIHDLHTLTE